MARPERISVIIPVYNGRRYLAEAIESVLAQTVPPFETIVVDDGSTDGSAEVARAYLPAIRYVYQSWSGLGAALNHGVQCARGDLYAFLDADDLWVPDKLASQTAVLAEEPGLDMVFGQVSQFYSPDVYPRAAAEAEEIFTGHAAGTMLIRRASFQRVGPFLTTVQVGQFIDWYAKALDVGLTGRMLPKVLLKRRIHASNLGLRQRCSRADYVHVVKAALDRRRQGQPRQEGGHGRGGAEGVPD